MLTRIHIDNFRGFTNFELALDSINLLLGTNGSGKTSVFDVLRKLQCFVVQEEKAREVFSARDCTRWSSSQYQKFELEFEEKDSLYKYILIIDAKSNEPQVQLEQLWVDQKLILNFKDKVVELAQSKELAQSQFMHRPFPLTANRSAIGSLPAIRELPQILSFQHILRRMMIVQVTPPKMEAYSSGVTRLLSPDTSNLISWYRFLMEDQARINEISNSLKELLNGFGHFELRTVAAESSDENSKTLLLHFEDQNQHGRTTAYILSELSDGQRALIALYALVIYAKRENILLCIDEPENFLALPEIQPWLIEVYDLCHEGKLQALLISHHPEMIDYLAAEAGIWFDRSGENGSVIAKHIENEFGTGLRMSELIARGWLNA